MPNLWHNYKLLIVKDEQGCIDTPEHLKAMTSFIATWWRPSFARWFECGRQYLRYFSFNHRLGSSKTDWISQTPGKIEGVPPARSMSLLGRPWAHQEKRASRHSLDSFGRKYWQLSQVSWWQKKFSGGGKDCSMLSPTTKVMKWRTKTCRFGWRSSLHGCSLYCAPYWLAINHP